ncbi:hypothetical protein B7463_g1347, partial [Scytalidium lignicola]
MSPSPRPAGGSQVAGRRSARSEMRTESAGIVITAKAFPSIGTMTCEKQFLPANNTFLYCSEACRLHDRSTQPYSQSRSNSYSTASPTTSSTPTSPSFTSPYGSSHTLYGISSPDDGPDILPRFSPTQSRPRSYYSPYPDSLSGEDSVAPVRPMTSIYHATSPQVPSQSLHSASSSSTALASLRELAIALPRTTSRTESDMPTDTSTSPLSKAWNFIPFANTKSGPNCTSNHTSTRSREDLHSYARTYGGVGTGVYAGAQGMERPLPPRTGPSGYGHRPRSVDLVTPFSVGL